MIPCPASMSFQVVVKISYLLLPRLLSPKFLGRESCIHYLLAEGPGVARRKIEMKIKKYFRFFKPITPPGHSWVSTKNVSPIGPAICPWKKNFKFFIACNTTRPPISVLKNFSPSGPALWPAIHNIYTNVLLLYRLWYYLSFKNKTNIFCKVKQKCAKTKNYATPDITII